jgi:hypothetical protein
MAGISVRPSFLAGLVALGLLALAGCSSAGHPARLRSVPVPDYASAEPVRGMERSTLCHQGRAITIVNIAVDAHLRHGDYFGACSEENRARHEAYLSEQAGAARSTHGRP